MSARALHRTRRQEAGLAAVEFAIALPLLLLLLLAAAEFGRVFLQFSMLSHATRDGVRYVAGEALNGSTGVVNVTADLQTRGRNLVVYGNIAGTGTPILPSMAPAMVTVANAGGGNVSVRSVYPYQPIVGSTLPTFGFGPPVDLGFNLAVEVTMRGSQR